MPTTRAGRALEKLLRLFESDANSFYRRNYRKNAIFKTF